MVRALQLEETRGPINAARIGYLCHVHVGAEGSAKGLCKKLLIRILPGNFLESEGGGAEGGSKNRSHGQTRLPIFLAQSGRAPRLGIRALRQHTLTMYFFIEGGGGDPKILLKEITIFFMNKFLRVARD